MGDTLSQHTLDAFHDELEKIAFMAGLRTLGSRLTNPIKGMKAGWKSMAPKQLLGMKGTPAQKNLANEIIDTTLAQGEKGFSAGRRRLFGAGTHLVDDTRAVGKSLRAGPKALAEELSRRGVTGQSKVTKYLPIGERTQAVAWPGMAVPGIARAVQGKQEAGEGGLGEQLGSAAGYAIPGVLAAGTGGLGTLALPLGASMLASSGGKAVDERLARKANRG